MHNHHTTSNHQPSLTAMVILLTGCVLGSLVTAGLDVLADGNPSTDTVARMIPYQGRLELNGEPLDTLGEPLPILFTLYDRPNGQNAVYTQMINVDVYRGRFTAMLGPVGEDGESIAEVVSAADDLHLAITLLGNPDDPNDDVPMSGRQRILATPYAMWSTSATNLTVGRNLTVAQDVIVARDMTVDRDARVGRNLRVTGDVDASAVDVTTVRSSSVNVTGNLSSATAQISGNLNAGATSVNSLSVSGSITAGNVSVANLVNCRICIRDIWSQGSTRCVGVNAGWSGSTNDNRLTSDGTPKQIRMDCGPGF
ncbi:MAG: hypothetical protein AAFS10_18140 [Myxococcota bacterium]